MRIWCIILMNGKLNIIKSTAAKRRTQLDLWSSQTMLNLLLIKIPKPYLGVLNSMSLLIFHYLSSNHFIMATKSKLLMQSLNIWILMIFPTLSTGEPKERLIKLRTKDNVVPAGHSVLFQVLKVSMQLKLATSLISVNNKLLTAVTMEMKDAMVVIFLKPMIMLFKMGSWKLQITHIRLAIKNVSMLPRRSFSSQLAMLLFPQKTMINSL